MTDDATVGGIAAKLVGLQPLGLPGHGGARVGDRERLLRRAAVAWVGTKVVDLELAARGNSQYGGFGVLYFIVVMVWGTIKLWGGRLFDSPRSFGSW